MQRFMISSISRLKKLKENHYKARASGMSSVHTNDISVARIRSQSC